MKSYIAFSSTSIQEIVKSVLIFLTFPGHITDEIPCFPNIRMTSLKFHHSFISNLLEGFIFIKTFLGFLKKKKKRKKED